MTNKIAIPLVVKNNRSCIGCTKCCEGWLAANIYGHEMYPGQSCAFLDNASKCCTIYENRPNDPCKGFFCIWRLELQVPEEFSPNKTGIILAHQEYDGVKYITAANAGKEISQEMLVWLLEYAKSNNFNAEWFINGLAHHSGDILFLEKMAKRYKTT